MRNILALEVGLWSVLSGSALGFSSHSIPSAFSVGNNKRCRQIIGIDKRCSHTIVTTRNVQQQQRMSNNIDDSSSPESSSGGKKKKNKKKEETSENNNNINNNINTPLDRAIQKARARAEVDRLTNGSDAVIDRDAELKKIIGGISDGLVPNSAEAELDKTVYTLESSMSKAVSEGDFQTAAIKRDEMDRMHIDDCGSVLQLNTQFYKAFSDKDYDTMKTLWLHCDNTVQCLHPSHKPMVGFKAVMESWKSMFDSKDDAFQMNFMEPSNIKLSVKGAAAWLTCDEDIYMPKFVRGKGKVKSLVKKMTTTNIFRKLDNKWYMVHHHATWHNDYAESKKNKFSKSDNSSAIQSTTINLGSGNGFGIPSPENSDGAVKRVFMGSLSDLLNGGLSDLLSGDENIKDNNENDGKAIIRVNSEYDEDDDEDDDDDDDDDDDKIISRWDKLSGITDLSDAKQSSSSSLSAGGVPKDALRQNCISALRKLANQGSISPKQKRLLLTDIVTCSAKGEFSMVEVAYELLCGEGDDKDAAEEEFADQCRVFATAMPDYPNRS